MVRKLQFNEYLKRYDNMDAGERKAYENRVGEWLSSAAPVLVARTADGNARLQNVMQLSGVWNDAECKAFEEGVMLLSALASSCDTWLPDMLYTKSAKRAIGRIVDTLQAEVTPQDGVAQGTGASVTSETSRVEPVPSAPSFQESDGDGDIAGGNKQREGVAQLTPVRPRHIDQYVHLLPQKTQEHAAQIKDLYRELDLAREKMNLLMDDETASPADREAWAKKATAVDNRIRKILDELDSEWDKLVKSGRVVVDDLGNAHVVDIEHGSMDAEPTSEEQAELTSEQKAKRRELRKWLVDTRRGNGDTRDEHVKKWLENFKAFVGFDGDAAYGDEKVIEAAKHYGIDLEEGELPRS